MNQPCDFCAKNSPLFDMKSRCCQIRFIIGMPAQRRQDYYLQYKREHGVDAANALIEEINQARQAKKGELQDVKPS